MDSEPLPKWMMVRYAMLWKKNKDKPFTMQDAASLIKEDEKVLAVLFSRLSKMGWLIAEFDPEDRRKRIYKLKEPEKVVEVMSVDY
jgi:type I restriction enzyme M protein